MKKAPHIYSLGGLINAATGVQAEIDGKWMPARPEGYYSLRHRIRAAWLVFTGRADAVKWPGGQ